jgi:hypothetical protein
VEFGSLGMREEYGESTGKTGRVFVFVSVLFLLGFGVHHLFRDKIRAAWIDHRRLVVSFFFELQTSLVVLL